MFLCSKLFASISEPFHVSIVLSLSSTLHSLENLVIAHCFPTLVHINFGEILQLKFRESVQFANIAKI